LQKKKIEMMILGFQT